MTPIDPVVVPLPGNRELRLTPTEGSCGRILIELAVWERGALFERSKEPLLLQEPMLRVLATALTRMAARLDKVNAREVEHDLWRPA